MEDGILSSEDQKVIPSSTVEESSTEHAEDGLIKVDQQYVLPFRHTLQKDQQLAIELTAENGEKYLYILSDGIPDEKTMVTADISTVNDEQLSSGVALVENVDQNKELEKLKQIEDRSCGTMTEELYMEPKQDDIQIKQNDAILPSNIKQKSQVQKLTQNFALKRNAINNGNALCVEDTTQCVVEKKKHRLISISTGQFEKEAKDLKEPEINIMNEMKIMPINTCQDTKKTSWKCK